MKCTGSVCGSMLCLSMLLVLGRVVCAQDASRWGDPVDGLRLSINIDYGAKDISFSIQNVSDQTLVVALGENGIPSSLTVTLTTADGRMRDTELKMSSAMHATGAGIHYHLIEILPKATYEIGHALGDFTPVPPIAGVPRVFPMSALTAGDVIAGHLRGKYQKCPTTDCRRYEVCWQGYLSSNTLRVATKP